MVKDKSTTLSDGYGFRSDSSTPALAMVKPVAKYQLEDPAVAQGVELQPRLLSISCETATPPASMSTTAPIHCDPPGTVSFTDVDESGPTWTGTVRLAPWLGTMVTDPEAATGPLLAMTTRPGAETGLFPAPLSVAPAQNHEDDNARIGAATGTGARAVTDWLAGLPPTPLSSTPITRTPATARRIGVR